MELSSYLRAQALDETCIPDQEVASADVRHVANEQPSSSNLLVQKLKSRLAGVPPPPQLTYPQHKIEDIIQLLKNNEWINERRNETDDTGSLREKVNRDQNLGETCPWPEVKQCVHFDICYNVDKATESLVSLCDVYRQRYVGCETSSFVTANSPSKYSGKKKERRKMIGRSPRRHLMQRRKIFSSNSLKEVRNKTEGDLSKKTILLQRDSNTDTKRALFPNADEQRRRRAYVEGRKGSPGKMKTLWMQRNLPTNRTPRKLTPKKFGASSQRTPKKATPSKKSGTPRKQTTPRSSQTPRKSEEGRKFNENGKRRLSDDEYCYDAALNYPASRDDTKQQTNMSSDLSYNHRRKLLWAVSAALGKVGIKQGHSNFRNYGKRLFHTCKLIWMSPLTEKAIDSRTSEQMLSIASEQLPAVMKEVDEVKKPENADFFSQDSNSWDCFANNT